MSSCVVCGKTFISVRNRRTCSGKCRTLLSRHKKEALKKVEDVYEGIIRLREDYSMGAISGKDARSYARVLRNEIDEWLELLNRRGE